MYRGKFTIKPSDFINEITEFCKTAYNESGDKNFEVKSDGTSSLLKHIKQNTIPMITMVFKKDKIISLSGVQKYGAVCLLAKRFYTLKKYSKSSMGKPNNFFWDYMYSPQLQWAVNNNYKAVMITFNEDKKRLIPVLEREQAKGRSFVSFIKHDKLLNINNTKQYVFYQKINENFNISDLDV